MARYRGKKALYEVMSKNRSKSGYRQTVEQIHPKKSEESNPAAINSIPASDKPRNSTLLWKKPRIIQVNGGRIEISMPYQIAIALILGLILIILAAFRIGQFFQPTELQVTQELHTDSQQNESTGPAEHDTVSNVKPSIISKGSTQKIKPAEPTKSTGNNVIVLTQYDRHIDLLPVQEHFRKYGIETEIVRERNTYFLQTVNKYDNPGRPGTDGFEARQKIIQAGAEYKGKAPEGRETFAPNYFKDAYGKKIEEN